jgi:hypothetical protein
MAIVYLSFEVLGTKWLQLMPHWLEFHGLNGYYICVLWNNSKVYMATIYAFFGVPRIEWLFICILWSFKGQDLLRDAPKTFLCFNTWGTNLGRVHYSHLVQHRHCCRVSMWRIHTTVMMCQFKLTSWIFFC